MNEAELVGATILGRQIGAGWQGVTCEGFDEQVTCLSPQAPVGEIHGQAWHWAGAGIVTPHPCN